MQLIKTENLVKYYLMGRTKFTALKDINLTFERGEFCGVIGPSGSGKTTLLNIIGSLDTPSEGSTVVLDKRIENISHMEAARLRSEHMGFIFQTYNLLPTYTVFENIEFPLLIMKMRDRERKEKVSDALRWLGLTPKAGSRPSQLSGGEAQRVAVARAIVKKPEIVLADEPTANLDAENSHNILKTMVKLNEELKTTFIFATHDEKVIGYLKRKIHLIDGRVAKDEKSPHTPLYQRGEVRGD
jgi:putative ABC transport system ATP-binding protein